MLNELTINWIRFNLKERKEGNNIALEWIEQLLAFQCFFFTEEAYTRAILRHLLKERRPAESFESILKSGDENIKRIIEANKEKLPIEGKLVFVTVSFAEEWGDWLCDGDSRVYINLSTAQEALKDSSADMVLPVPIGDYPST